MMSKAAVFAPGTVSQIRRTVGSLSSARILTGIVQTASRGRAGGVGARTDGRNRKPGKGALDQFELVTIAADIVDAPLAECLLPWQTAVLETHADGVSHVVRGHRNHFLAIQSAADLWPSGWMTVNMTLQSVWSANTTTPAAAGDGNATVVTTKPIRINNPQRTITMAVKRSVSKNAHRQAHLYPQVAQESLRNS